MTERSRLLLAALIALGAVMTVAAGMPGDQDWQRQQPQSPPGLDPTPPSTATPTPPPAQVFMPFVIHQDADSIFLPLVRDVEPTRTPTPTSTPTAAAFTPPVWPSVPAGGSSWPNPLEKPGHSKLGLHVEWNNSPDIMEFIRRTKPAVVKAVGDLGFLAEVEEVSPSTVTIARLGQGPQKVEGDPVKVARSFVAEHLGQYQLNPAVDYWEGWNEPNVQGRLHWYAAFEAERARLMAEQGFRVAVGGFSTGVPEWGEFAAFLPAIEAAKEYGGIFTVHEYDAPTMDRSFGAGLPERSDHPRRGALMLRYRWWYEDFMKPQDLVVPLVVSEAGIDGGIGNRPGPEGLGWRDFTGYWESQGMGPDTVNTYIRQLAWYDAELRGDDYVIGFAVFTAGVITERWESFDITPILPEIATYVAKQR